MLCSVRTLGPIQGQQTSMQTMLLKPSEVTLHASFLLFLTLRVHQASTDGKPFQQRPATLHSVLSGSQ